jgi:anti-anti-sigma regulatory factor
MTLMAVNEGVFRAQALTDNRGLRKRRGEFLPVTSEHIEFSAGCSKDGRDEPEAELRLQYTDNSPGCLTLVVAGTLNVTTVLPFRDAVFTAIGKKPLNLVIDVTSLRDADISGISSLVTAGRVAQLMKVPFSVSPSPFLKALLEDTGIRLTTAVTDPLH